MRKLHRAGAAVAVLSLVLTVSAFTREGTRSTVTCHLAARWSSPGGRLDGPARRGARSSTR